MRNTDKLLAFKYSYNLNNTHKYIRFLNDITLQATQYLFKNEKSSFYQTVNIRNEFHLLALSYSFYKISSLKPWNKNIRYKFRIFMFSVRNKTNCLEHYFLVTLNKVKAGVLIGFLLLGKWVNYNIC